MERDQKEDLAPWRDFPEELGSRSEKPQLGLAAAYERKTPI